MLDDCGEIRESISATLDGEPTALDPADIELHLTGCDACRRWREAAHEVTRQYRLQEALAQQPAPQALRSAVLATMPRQRPGFTVAVRVALVMVGVAQMVVTGRLLLSGDIDSFRDLGALGVALGVGFLVAAFRPYRAIGMRPIVATAALLLVGSAVLDLVHHRTTVSDEAPHLLAVAGWLLVMFLAWRTPDLGAPPSSFRQWTAHARHAVDLASRRLVTGWHHGIVRTGSVVARDAGVTAGDQTGGGIDDIPGIPVGAAVAAEEPRRAVGQ